MSTTEENPGLLAQATAVLSSAVGTVTEALVGGTDTSSTSGAAPTAPHGDAPTNANPSGEVAFEDKTLVGKAADLTNRAVEAVTAQVSSLTGTAPSTGAAPTAPHGDAPTNSNPSGEVAFEDKTLVGKATDLTNRAVEAVTAQVSSLTGTAPSTGAAPTAPHGDAPTNDKPSGEVAFQDKTLAGKAVDLTNRAVEVVTAQASNLTAQASDIAAKVGEQAQQLKDTTVAATQQAAQAVGAQVEAAKEGAQNVAQQAKEGAQNVSQQAKEGAQDAAQQAKASTTATAEVPKSGHSGPGSSDIPLSAFEPDPKTGKTTIYLSGFSSGDAETLSERVGYENEGS